MIISEHLASGLWGPGKVDYHGTTYICFILINILCEITGFMCSILYIIISLDNSYITLTYMSIIFHFYRCENWGLVMWCDLCHTLVSVAQLETKVRIASCVFSQRTNCGASLGKFTVTRKKENVSFFLLNPWNYQFFQNTCYYSLNLKTKTKTSA